MKTPEPDDNDDRQLWRRVRRAARPEDAADALRNAVNDPDKTSTEDFIADALAGDPELLAMVRAAHRDATPSPASAEDLARAKALVRPAPVRQSALASLRDWLAGQFSAQSLVPRLAFVAAFALVCTVGYAAGQSDRARRQSDGAGLNVDLLGVGDGDMFDVTSVLEMGGRP